MDNIEVTVIIASYNPIYEKLVRTILSVVYQKDVKTQIIVADDGSKENYFEELEKLLKSKGYKNYTLLASDRNHGTISNLMRTEKYVEGKYIKLISPGDYLYDEDTLGEWYQFADTKGIEVSFGDAVYYCYEGKEYRLLSEYVFPQTALLYTEDGRNRKKIILNYFLLQDKIVGALYLIRREIMFQYLRMIEGRITYTEDNMFRLMLLNGVNIVHFAFPVVFYEYGIGISTGKDPKWTAILDKEYKIVDRFIYESKEKASSFNRKIKYMLRIRENKKTYTIIKYSLFPQLIYWQIKKRILKKYSRTDYPTDFLDEIHK